MHSMPLSYLLVDTNWNHSNQQSGEVKERALSIFFHSAFKDMKACPDYSQKVDYCIKWDFVIMVSGRYLFDCVKIPELSKAWLIFAFAIVESHLIFMTGKPTETSGMAWKQDFIFSECNFIFIFFKLIFDHLSSKSTLINKPKFEYALLIKMFCSKLS